MIFPKLSLSLKSFIPQTGRWFALAVAGNLVFGLVAFSQQTTPTQPATPPDVTQPPATPAASGSPAQDAAPQQATPGQPAGVQTAEPALPPQAQPAEAASKREEPAELTVPSGTGTNGITEEQLKQMLVGKDFFLRGGYLGDSVSFDEFGHLTGHLPLGSYTLCGVRIDRVRLSKHKLELEGARYGLHFLGALPYEDPTKAVDRVRITPKKKVLKLTIDREEVVKAKKEKEPKQAKGKGKAGPEAGAKTGAGAAAVPAESAQQAPVKTSEADEARTDVAATPDADQPAGPVKAPTTTSPARANSMLITALNKVFATGIDERMKDHMPKFWKLYYQAAEAKTDYTPPDPAVMRQTNVDQKAKLLTSFEPDSNEYAQAAGVAGMALYHVVVEADGKPGEIAVARPIGFGLDESAVASIRKASFSPAIKDGKPVPVLLDLVVQFRIYSKRTSVVTPPGAEDKDKAPALPGPYSVNRPKDGSGL